ncbi:Thioredoxin superfamily protein [Zea mays]|uniref:Thioredoxin superfamily protein n=1 Tax=Zea mays TaxID=4577 RepID=A0A1D6FQ50_MAIZE|nr:Thioredoxin superfamily protein [Zea mays]
MTDATATTTANRIATIANLVCVAVDACAEPDLVDALKVSGFPEILFTNAGRIIHREKVVRSAEAWSRMMAFFYYKAARPPFLCEADGKGQEKVPLMS